VSANGYGKRTPISEWRVQGRGGLGIIAMDMSERNGELVRLCLARPEDQLMAITDAGVVIRTRIGEIRETGRNTQGVRVIRLGDNEKVVDVEPIARAESEEGADELVEQAAAQSAAELDGELASQGKDDVEDADGPTQEEGDDRVNDTGGDEGPDGSGQT
jgi:DNA gyrase subunit A